MVGRSLVNPHSILKRGQGLTPVRSYGQRGFSEHGVQVRSADANEVHVVLARSWIPPFQVPVPAHFTLEGYTQMGALHSLHHLPSARDFVVPEVSLLIHDPWHREVGVPMVGVARRMPHVATGRQFVSGEAEVSAVYSLHLLHRFQTPCANPSPFPPTT